MALVFFLLFLSAVNNKVVAHKASSVGGLMIPKLSTQAIAYWSHGGFANILWSFQSFGCSLIAFQGLKFYDLMHELPTFVIYIYTTPRFHLQMKFDSLLVY